jgi:GT2 family glycosyltransferase
MVELGFNAVRLYEAPTREMLDAATAHGLKLLCGVPWTQHVDFLADAAARTDAIERVRSEARRLAGEQAVAGLIVGNEIEKTLVRWMGPERVRDFLEKLIGIAKAEAPAIPVSYASYPSTEYLVPRNADFVAFNVFLEKPDAFAAYVSRLQHVAGDKPLIISEFGLDTQRNGEAAQADVMAWQREGLLQAGVAGGCWFSFTDEWHRGGEEVTDWDFGLVTRDRRPKQACFIAATLPTVLRLPDADGAPLVSVVVCTHNGAPTLRECLEALRHQRYARYEVLVIDDGSTDATPDTAREFEFAHYHRQDHAGLSAARNLGMKLAKGSILAYTDDDCMPDEDWILHLASAFDDEQWVAAGGPNIPPPARNLTEAVVAVAPGAPTHVLLNDVEAEHLPGCNLSIRKSALEAIGGFREEFRAAGDDVDVCWRLQAAGGRLCFVPGAVVWHHRRAAVRGYLRQQSGYGRAEALLIGRFADRFAWFGGARWNGAIYGTNNQADLRGIEFGRRGLAPFQCIYSNASGDPLMMVTGLPWFVSTLVLSGLAAFASSAGLMFAALVKGIASLLVAWREAKGRLSGKIRPMLKQRLLLASLCWLQPIVRDWARLRGMMAFGAWPKGRSSTSLADASLGLGVRWLNWSLLEFWNETGVDREALLDTMQRQSSAHGVAWRETSGQDSRDAELRSHGASFAVTTVTEYHGGGQCLTKVRLGSAINLLLVSVLAALGASSFVGKQLGWPDTVRLALSAVFLVTMTVVFVRHYWGMMAVQKLICGSAELCGLAEKVKPEEILPEELHRQALAPSRERAEICLEES